MFLNSEDRDPTELILWIDKRERVHASCLVYPVLNHYSRVNVNDT